MALRAKPVSWLTAGLLSNTAFPPKIQQWPRAPKELPITVAGQWRILTAFPCISRACYRVSPGLFGQRIVDSDIRRVPGEVRISNSAYRFMSVRTVIEVAADRVLFEFREEMPQVFGPHAGQPKFANARRVDDPGIIRQLVKAGYRCRVPAF